MSGQHRIESEEERVPGVGVWKHSGRFAPDLPNAQSDTAQDLTMRRHADEAENLDGEPAQNDGDAEAIGLNQDGEDVCAEFEAFLNSLPLTQLHSGCDAMEDEDNIIKKTDSVVDAINNSNDESDSHKSLEMEEQLTPVRKLKRREANESDTSPSPPKLKPFYERLRYGQWRKLVKRIQSSDPEEMNKVTSSESSDTSFDISPPQLSKEVHTPEKDSQTNCVNFKIDLTGVLNEVRVEISTNRNEDKEMKLQKPVAGPVASSSPKASTSGLGSFRAPPAPTQSADIKDTKPVNSPLKHSFAKREDSSLEKSSTKRQKQRVSFKSTKHEVARSSKSSPKTARNGNNNSLLKRYDDISTPVDFNDNVQSSRPPAMVTGLPSKNAVKTATFSEPKLEDKAVQSEDAEHNMTSKRSAEKLKPIAEEVPRVEKIIRHGDINLKEAKIFVERINMNLLLENQNRKRSSETVSMENKSKRRRSVGDKVSQDSFPLQDKNGKVERKRRCSSSDKVSVRKSTDRRSASSGMGKDSSKDIRYLKKVVKKHLPASKSLSTKILKQLMQSPKVYIKKLRLDDMRVLENVPGLNDLELIQPESNDRVVQVVQVPGGRPTTTITSQNSQTSTQITPHIQRIGQPRVDKPVPATENSESAVTTAPSEIKPARSQPSTLIHMLSSQVAAPAQSIGSKVQILSHHLIKPTTTTAESTPKTSAATTSRASRTTRTTADWQTISHADDGHSKRTVSTKQASTQAGSNSNDQNCVVQFVCKSTDTKATPVTNTSSNRIVKTTQTSSIITAGNSNSNFAQGFSRFPKQKTSEEAETLPKFQQAFGKSAYQNNVDNNSIPNNNIDTEKKIVRTTSVVQSIPSSVIYARQVPVAQAINLIPQGRGQLFRIATTNSDSTVIQSKMSALLAAALQGKPKSESSTETIVSNSGTSVRPTLTTQVVKPAVNASTTRSNNSQPNLSSTTLEQLREFDMVYKQVKERSNTNTGTEAIVETNEGQRMNVTFVGQTQKFTQLSPVVVVSNYCSLQSATSPGLSVTSQGSSSPSVTSATTSSVPKVAVKTSKGKTVKNTTASASKTPPTPKPQPKPQEDEHTTQRIFDILAEYAEQLRNSPDLNNKPAPRRRSNPPTNPNPNSKRKKNNNSKKPGQCSSTISSDADLDDPRTIGSEDSSSGVLQMSMQEEEQSTASTQTNENSNETSIGPCQPLIIADSSSNRTRNVIIAESSVGEALKMPNTAVLVPGNYIMPVSMVKGGQQIAVVSGGSKILATVPARSGSNMLLFQSFLNQGRKSAISTVKYSTIQPFSSVSSGHVAASSSVILPSTSQGLTTVTVAHPVTVKKDNEQNNSELELPKRETQATEQSAEVPNIQSSNNNISTTETNKPPTPPAETSAENALQNNTTSIATSVISQTTSVKEDQQPQTEQQKQQHFDVPLINTIPTQDVSKVESPKVERMQSVVMTASSSNGSILPHTSSVTASNNKSCKTEVYRIVDVQKIDNKEQQQQQKNSTISNKHKKQALSTVHNTECEVHSTIQHKKLDIDKELLVQKTLTEKCQDLDVAQASTSDSISVTEVVLDHSNSATVSLPETNKDEPNMFTGDDTGSATTSALFDDTSFEYGPPNQVLQIGKVIASTSGCSREDNTIQNPKASGSGTPLNSLPDDDPYLEQEPPANKYKYKYCNRKKLERSKQQETWTQEASGSAYRTDEKKSSHSSEISANRNTNKNLGAAKTKTDPKEKEECVESKSEQHHGRSAKRASKKSSINECNEEQHVPALRKRTSAGQVQMQSVLKKTGLGKKR